MLQVIILKLKAWIDYLHRKRQSFCHYFSTFLSNVGCKLSFRKCFHWYPDIRESVLPETLPTERSSISSKKNCVPKLNHIMAVRPEPLFETENWKLLIKIYCTKVCPNALCPYRQKAQQSLNTTISIFALFIWSEIILIVAIDNKVNKSLL